MNIKMNFSQLVTQALTEGNGFLLSRIPKHFLKPIEDKVHNYILDCTKEGFTPTVERLKDEIKFFHQPIEVPAKVAYMAWMGKRRDEFIVRDINDYLTKNESKPDGIFDELKRLDTKYSILAPDIIDYQEYDRNGLVTNLYHSKYHIPFMDEWTNGLVGGDFITFLAGTKSYKTTILKELTLGAFLNGENVLFCSQEQTPVKMLGQFDALGMGMNHSVFRNELGEELISLLKNHEKRVKKHPGKLYITPRISTVNQLKEYVLSLPVKIHKIFIDGLNLMTGGGEGGYVAVAQNTADLKAFAEEYGLIIILVTQKNREGNKHGVDGDVSHVGSSIAIALYSDLMVNMSILNEKIPGSQIDFCVYLSAMLNRHGSQDHKMLMLPIYNGDTYYTKYVQLSQSYDPMGTNSASAVKKSELSQIASELSMTDDQFAQAFREKTGMKLEEAGNTFGIEGVKELVEHEF